MANPLGDTSGTQYNVIVILNQSGVSYTCVAGLRGACTHIALLNVGAEDFVGFLMMLESLLRQLRNSANWMLSEDHRWCPHNWTKLVSGRTFQENWKRESNVLDLNLQQGSYWE